MILILQAQGPKNKEEEEVEEQEEQEEEVETLISRCIHASKNLRQITVIAAITRIQKVPIRAMYFPLFHSLFQGSPAVLGP